MLNTNLGSRKALESQHACVSHLTLREKPENRVTIQTTTTSCSLLPLHSDPVTARSVPDMISLTAQITFIFKRTLFKSFIHPRPVRRYSRSGRLEFLLALGLYCLFLSYVRKWSSSFVSCLLNDLLTITQTLT